MRTRFVCFRIVALLRESHKGMMYREFDPAPAVAAMQGLEGPDRPLALQTLKHLAARHGQSTTVDREGLISFFASMGWIADLPDPERLPLLGQIRSHLTHGQYRRVWDTHVHWTRLTAPESAVS